MSDSPQGPGWWLASDGRWYPPESATTPAPPPPPPLPYPAPEDGSEVSQPIQNPPIADPTPYGQLPYGGQAYSPPTPYPQPPPYYGYVQGPKTDSLAVASLISSIVGAVLVVFCVGLAGTVAGVVMGFIARNRIKQSNGQLTGEGLALAGIIVGALATLGYFAFLALFVASNSTTGGS